MNNLTTNLLTNHYHYDIEEWSKQGNAIPFDSGIEQRIVNYSIPSIELNISYKGVNWEEFESLRASYEANNSNTFIVDLNDETAIPVYIEDGYVEASYFQEELSRIDLRPDLMTTNAAVWAFKNFTFKIDAKSLLYSGRITLVSSVFFNFSQYQDLFTQTSSYSISVSTDESFVNVLTEAQPYAAELKYANNSIFSNIGQSVRHARNKGGLKRAWSLYWLLTEPKFLKLIQFYRKKSGIMGEFGMPEYGTTHPQLKYFEDDYIVTDYVVRGVTDYLSNARFNQDSFQYQKRVDGMYQCRADILEVKL